MQKADRVVRATPINKQHVFCPNSPLTEWPGLHEQGMRIGHSNTSYAIGILYGWRLITGSHYPICRKLEPS